jgi:hypothetical protein
MISDYIKFTVKIKGEGFIKQYEVSEKLTAGESSY